MIYRIICSAIGIPGRIPSCLLGAFMVGVDGFNLKQPDIADQRARFYFTDKGWRRIGRFVAVNARRDGRVVRVVRRRARAGSPVNYFAQAMCKLSR